ncbi:hypothetical protein S83_047207, partial [Arachis hypogaea]
GESLKTWRKFLCLDMSTQRTAVLVSILASPNKITDQLKRHLTILLTALHLIMKS